MLYVHVKTATVQELLCDEWRLRCFMESVTVCNMQVAPEEEWAQEFAITTALGANLL